MTGAGPPVANLLDLTGRVALVTAGSGGIGAGIARRLAEAGARGAQAVVKSIGTAGGRAVAVGAVVVAAGSNLTLAEVLAAFPRGDPRINRRGDFGYRPLVPSRVPERVRVTG